MMKEAYSAISASGRLRSDAAAVFFEAAPDDDDFPAADRIDLFANHEVCEGECCESVEQSATSGRSSLHGHGLGPDRTARAARSRARRQGMANHREQLSDYSMDHAAYKTKPAASLR